MDDGTNSNHGSTKSDSTVWKRPDSHRGSPTKTTIPLQPLGSPTTVPKLETPLPNNYGTVGSGYCRACNRSHALNRTYTASHCDIKKNIVKRIWEKLK